MTKKDAVNPSHYRRGDIECIDALRACLTEEEWSNEAKFFAAAIRQRENTND